MAGERLSADDGLKLYRSRDVLAVGWLANHVRERLHGDVTYFNVNRHINPTNVCVAACKLCAFGRKKGDAGGYTMATTVYVFNLEKYRPIVRPAVLTGFLGYLFVVIGLLVDLGSPWRLPVPVLENEPVRNGTSWPTVIERAPRKSPTGFPSIRSAVSAFASWPSASHSNICPFWTPCLSAGSRRPRLSATSRQ